MATVPRVPIVYLNRRYDKIKAYWTRTERRPSTLGAEFLACYRCYKFPIQLPETIKFPFRLCFSKHTIVIWMFSPTQETNP